MLSRGWDWTQSKNHYFTQIDEIFSGLICIAIKPVPPSRLTDRFTSVTRIVSRKQCVIPPINKSIWNYSQSSNGTPSERSTRTKLSLVEFFANQNSTERDKPNFLFMMGEAFFIPATRIAFCGKNGTAALRIWR